MVLFDEVVKFGKSTLQHGPNNNRIYLMKLDAEDKDIILNHLYNLAVKNKYSKIFAKVPESMSDLFLKSKFRSEAKVPGFYKGEECCEFLGLYLKEERSIISDKDKKLIDTIVKFSSEPFVENGICLPEGYIMKPVGEEHLDALAELYKIVFDVYPFPIFDKAYLLETLKDHVRYFGVFKGDELVAASSAEIDFENKNAEMTDFATRPDQRGKKLSYFLLKYMEEEMKKAEILTVYTIARAVSFGMNKTFGRLHYTFGGTLINNTQIGSSIECMNVWYKSLK